MLSLLPERAVEASVRDESIERRKALGNGSARLQEDGHAFVLRHELEDTGRPPLGDYLGD
jgi:hypothetical protein